MLTLILSYLVAQALYSVSYLKDSSCVETISIHPDSILNLFVMDS